MNFSCRAANLFMLAVCVLFLAGAAPARNLDVPFVPTPYNAVEAMLDAAGVGPGDYVIDLGSGDGRIVIAAAQRGAFGHGIDLNPIRVMEAETNALDAGVADAVMFVEGDLFEADISQATVITMYLLHSVNMKLKPALFETLRPGTRVVSYTFSMGRWRADAHLQVGGRDVYHWVIPANLKGRWEWSAFDETFTMEVRQEFQEITVELSIGGRALEVRDAAVNGERVSFFAFDPDNGIQYAYSGRVENDSISGMVQTRSGDLRGVENWSASLAGR